MSSPNPLFFSIRPLLKKPPPGPNRVADRTKVESPRTIEQRDRERFLERHRNITAYFHGNSNWNEFYDRTGPSHTLTLHTFRVDSRP